MWIFCCGMKRSGSTLQYNIARDIVEALDIGVGVGYVEAQEFASFSRKYLDDNKYYIIKSHTFIPEYQALYNSNQALALFTYRDIRDVILSLTRKNSQSFYNILLNGEIQEIIQNDALWSSIDGTQRSKYEEFVNNLEGEITHIANHLNLRIDKNIINQIIQNNNIDSQKTKIERFDFKNVARYSHEIAYMPDTLFHPNHIQSGKIAEWKTYFSHSQIILIELLTCQWLTENGYEISHPKIACRMKNFGKCLSFITNSLFGYKRIK